MGELKEPSGIQKLEQKIGKFDSAMGQVSRIHDTLGTPEGHPFYDLSGIDEERYPDFYKKSKEEVGRVKLELANKTFAELLERRDMLTDYLSQARIAEENFRRAENKYLASDGEGDVRTALDAAHSEVQNVRDEIDRLFTRPTKTPVKRAQEEIGLTTTSPPQDEELTFQKVVASEKKEVQIRPVGLRLSTDFVRYVEKTQLFDRGRMPIEVQAREIGLRIAEMQAGTLTPPSPKNFLDANDLVDKSALITLAAQTLQAMIASKIIRPDGSISEAKGLQNILGQDMNTLITMAGVKNVVDSLERLNPLERMLLFNSLSVTMKEKLGCPDLETCTAEDMAAYFEDALYDELAPERKRAIRNQRKDYFGTEERLYERPDPYFTRKTDLPIPVEDIFATIMERDLREPAYAQMVITILLSHEKTAGRKSENHEQENIVNFILTKFIDICESSEQLPELLEFYRSHPNTTRLAKMVAKRIGENNGDTYYGDRSDTVRIHDREDDVLKEFEKTLL